MTDLKIKSIKFYLKRAKLQACKYRHFEWQPGKCAILRKEIIKTK